MPAKDFVITINTDTPGVFDAVEEWLDDHGASWDAIMTSKPTGDQWTKGGQPEATSLNEPARLRLVDPSTLTHMQRVDNDGNAIGPLIPLGDEPPC